MLLGSAVSTMKCCLSASVTVTVAFEVDYLQCAKFEIVCAFVEGFRTIPMWCCEVARDQCIPLRAVPLRPSRFRHGQS